MLQYFLTHVMVNLSEYSVVSCTLSIRHSRIWIKHSLGIQQAGWSFRNLLLQALLCSLLSCCAYFLSFFFSLNALLCKSVPFSVLTKLFENAQDVIAASEIRTDSSSPKNKQKFCQHLFIHTCCFPWEWNQCDVIGDFWLQDISFL